MKLIISFILIVQISINLIAAEVGQKKEFSPRSNLLQILTQSRSNKFYESVKADIDKANAEGMTKFIEESQTLTPEEKETFKKLIEKSSVKRPNLYEISPGVWRAKFKKYTVSISIEDLYNGKIKINDRDFDFSYTPASELESKLLDFALTLERTSYLKLIFDKTLGIESAEAAILVPAMVIAAIAAIGYALYKWKYQPEQTVQALNEMKSKIDQDLATCEQAGSNAESYDKTFEMVSSPTSNLQKLLMKQLESDSSTEDCYQVMYEAGKKIGIEIPPVAEAQKQKLATNDGANKANKRTDSVGALYSMCTSYDRLSSCMSGFVQGHVNNSDVKDFKEKAVKHYPSYKRKSSSGAAASKQ